MVAIFVKLLKETKRIYELCLIQCFPYSLLYFLFSNCFRMRYLSRDSFGKQAFYFHEIGGKVCVYCFTFRITLDMIRRNFVQNWLALFWCSLKSFAFTMTLWVCYTIMYIPHFFHISSCNIKKEKLCEMTNI